MTTRPAFRMVVVDDRLEAATRTQLRHSPDEANRTLAMGSCCSTWGLVDPIQTRMLWFNGRP